MKRKVFTLLSSILLPTAIYAQDINVSKFDTTCVDYIWKYDTTNISNPQWQVHIANGQNYSYTGSTISSLNQGDGFWVKGNDINGCDVNTTVIENLSIFTNDMIVGKTLYFVQNDDFGHTEQVGFNVAEMIFNSDGTMVWNEIETKDSGVFNTTYTQQF